MNSLCSIELLESALSGNLTAENEVALHRHLEECESCATTMEQLAGGPGWCQEAAALLGADELDSNAAINRDDWSVVDFTVEHLEPAEEPNTLGRLGGYDVLEIIGRGGMGVVLKGFDRELKRCVAIKVLAPHLAHSPLARKRFAREAQAAAAVVHPHVLAIHQVQPGGRLPFLVMPLVAGESLAQRLTARGTLELKEILRIGMQAAAGLAAAHEQGLVHRDVKPANILLEKGVERAVLTDFGLARAADDVAMTRWGIIAGTPQYMSPEQAQGQTLDGRSDLFSLGCVLYEMATGTSPFRADSTIATLRRLVDDQPASMITLNSELPQWFVNIVDRLLEKSPAQRFESAAEVSDLLERCLAHVQQPTTVSLPDEICFATQKPSVPAPTKTRLPLKSAGIAWGAIIALLLFLGCVWWVPAMLGSAGKAERAASETNLHRLTAALIAYVEEHGHFPASAIYGKDGKGGPPHSWRVEILPYLGHRALYEQYRFDELWDSEQNSTLMAKMPDVLRSPVDSRDSVNTAYFGVISGDAKAVVDAAPLTTATSAQTLGRTPGGLENSSPPGNSAPPLSDASVSTDRGEVVKLNAVDEFVARRLAARQWGMLYLNNKSEWLRRTTLDLVGTLPSEADVRAFLSDDSSTAMDRAVERLLTGTKQLTRGTIAEGVFVPDGSTIFSRPLGAKYSEIPDGTMHTIAIVEAKRSIPWTKPEDLTYDSTQNASPLGGWYKEGWYAGFADGNVKFVPLDTLPARLRAYFTIQGGEIDSATSSLQLDKTELQPRDAIENPLPSEKVINGRIIAINEQEGTVTVNAGSQQGVKNREFFLVLRDIRALEPVTSKVLKGTQLTSTVQLVEVRRNQIVGRLRVVRVDEHESIAQIEETDRAGLRVDDKVQLARLTISAPAPNSARQTQQGAESPANTGSVPATPSPPPANVSSVLGVDGFNGTIRLYDQSLTECATEALTLLNQESPQATQQIERELRAELDSVARLAQEFGGESRIVQRQKEVFFRRILQEIGVRIDRRRHRNSRDGAVLTRLDNLLATVRLGENTASNRYVGSIDLLARISDPVNAVGWRERFGEQFDLEIVGNITGPIWGTDVYTDDSAIATAAVHAGLVQVGEKATVTVTIVRPGKYVGSTRHGVTSSDWSNAWLSSYVLQRKLAVKPIERADSSGPGASWQLPPNQLQFNFWVANPTNSIPFQEQLGAQFDVEVTGHAGGAIWGTDVYTSDSNVGMAAVHAGLLQVGEKATVTVTIVKSPEKYAGSIRHGITSSDYGPFVSGYILSRTQDASKTSSAQFDQALLNTPFNQQELRHNELWMELLVDCPNDQFDQAARQHLLDIGRYFVFPRPDEPPCSPWLAKLRKDESVKLQSLAFAARTRALRPGELPSEHWNLLALNPAIEIGQTFYCAVTGRVDGVVWGAGPYTSDSDIGTAAVHAGWVKEGETRVLTVRIVDGTKEASFSGSTANGVATQAFGPYPTAFIFEQLPLNVPESVPSTTTSLRKVLIDVTLEELEEVRADEQRATQVLNKRLRDLQANSEIVLPSPAGKSPSRERHTLTSFRNRVGQSFYFFVMGTDYGVSHREGNSFSLESDLGHAATKSGAVKAGEFGVVQVKIIKGPVQSRRPDAVLSDAAPATDEVRFTVEKASDAVAKKFLHLEGGEPKLSPELATELVRFTEAINQNRTSLEPFPEFTNSPFGMGQARYVAATCYGADLQRNAASALSNATQALQFPLTMPQRVRLHLIAGDASLMIVKPSASQRRLDAAAWYLDGLQLIREFQIPEQLPVGAPEFTDFAFPLNGKGRSVVEVLHGLRASLRGHLLDVYGNLNISKPDVDELRKLREMAQDRLLATDDFLKQVRRIGAARQ